PALLLGHALAAGVLGRLGPLLIFFSSRRRHTRFSRDWSSDVCSSDLLNTISGLDTLKSISVDSVTQVVAMFDLDKDPDVAAQERSEERRVGQGGGAGRAPRHPGQRGPPRRGVAREQRIGGGAGGCRAP